MEDYLFNTPVWFLIVIGVTGMLFAWAGLARGEKRDKLLGGIGVFLLLVAAGLFIVSKIVETDKEQVVRRSRELVAAVEAKDWPALRDHLTPKAEVLNQGSPMCTDREQILDKAKYYTNLAGHLELQVTNVEPRQTVGDTWTTEIATYVKGEKGAQLVVTDVTWKKDGKVWSAQLINVKQIGLQPK